jgi:hypothetical protein
MGDSTPNCIGTNICLRPSFQEWYDEECPHCSAQCGSYAEHGLGLREVCDHEEGPKPGLRTVTLAELAGLRTDEYENVERLVVLALDTVQEYKAKS